MAYQFTIWDQGEMASLQWIAKAKSDLRDRAMRFPADDWEVIDRQTGTTFAWEF